MCDLSVEGLSEFSHLICNPSVRITNAMRRTGDLLLQSSWTFLSSDRILNVWNVCDLSQFEPIAAPSSFPVCNLESETATRWIYLCKNRDQMTDGLLSIFQPTRARRYAGKTESKNCNYFPRLNHYICYQSITVYHIIQRRHLFHMQMELRY